MQLRATGLLPALDGRHDGDLLGVADDGVAIDEVVIGGEEEFAIPITKCRPLLVEPLKKFAYGQLRRQIALDRIGTDDVLEDGEKENAHSGFRFSGFGGGGSRGRTGEIGGRSGFTRSGGIHAMLWFDVFLLQGAYERKIPVTTVVVEPVPVPAAVWLFASGLLGLISLSRRR